MTQQTFDINALIEQRDFSQLKSLLDRMEPADVEELLNDVPDENWIIVFRLLHKDMAADVFTELEPEEQAELLTRFKEFRVREIIQELDPDDRTELLEELPAEVVRRLLQYLSYEDRLEAQILLGYPDDSVGREMTTEFVELKENWTVGQALEHIRRTAPDKETIYNSYITSHGHKLVGVISLKDLLLAADDELVANLMNPHIISVHTTADREEAARELAKYDFLALPVVDSEDRLVGMITIDDVLDVLEEEATEDIARMAAVAPIDRPYLTSSIWQLVRSRIFWLALLLILEGVTTSVMDHFEEFIAGMVLLTFFVPTLVGVGGNTGAQISAVIIRGMSIGELTNKDVWRIALKEMLAGAIIAIILGILLFGRVLLLRPQYDLAVAVAIALGVVVWYSNMIGALLPLAAKKVGIDPAMMAGPLVTTIVDITGVAMYFGIVKLILL